MHGWCCDWTVFQPQFDHFAQTHAVTALDLRGCGQSDSPEGGYNVRDFAEDLGQFCRVVEIDRPVVIGHSLGGMIAVEFAARYPSVPRALVLVDPGPIDPLPESVRFFEAAAEQLEGPSGEEVRRLWAEGMGARDEELAHWIADLMCKVPLPTAAAVIREVNAWNGVGALALCTVPTLLLRPSLADSKDPTPVARDQTRSGSRGHRRCGPLPPTRGARAGECHDRALPSAQRLTTLPPTAAQDHLVVRLLRLRGTLANTRARERCFLPPALLAPLAITAQAPFPCHRRG